jgi:hypothetical protein
LTFIVADVEFCVCEIATFPATICAPVGSAFAAIGSEACAKKVKSDSAIATPKTRAQNVADTMSETNFFGGVFNERSDPSYRVLITFYMGFIPGSEFSQSPF